MKIEVLYRCTGYGEEIVTARTEDYPIDNAVVPYKRDESMKDNMLRALSRLLDKIEESKKGKNAVKN